MRRKNKKQLKAIDFFCGAGGVTNGFISADIKVKAGIDIDIKCKETYEKNNKSKFYNWDISQVNLNILKKELKIKKKDDNLIFIGCSPCQYYSNIKTDKEKSKSTRLLLDDFADFVEYYLPGFIFIENVPGFKKNPESPIEKFKKFIESYGYFYDEKVINFKYYGVPQNRRRYILLASRMIKNIKLPEENRETINTVKQVIGDYALFKPIKAGTFDNTNFQHSSAELTDINLSRLEQTPSDGGDRRSWQNNSKLQLECYKHHTGHYDVYGRMYWDKPSPAITTRFRSLSNGRYGHPEQNRAISLREGATLQTFPLDYVFYSESLDIIARMIGNAVPPKFSNIIADEIKKQCNNQ